MSSSTNLIPLTGMNKIEFTPKDFDPGPDAPTFFIRVPTFAIRDKLEAIIFQRGLIPVTMWQGRALLVDALFDLYPEAEAEEKAAFLEDYWTKSNVHDEVIQAWQLREAQRLFDISMGVRKPLPQEPVPPSPFGMRDQSRQSRIITDALNNHEPYRSFQARFMVQEEEHEEMTIRLFLDGWKNCGWADAERDETDKLTEDCIEQVRNWLAHEGAPTAWDEVKRTVKEQFGAPGKLEKNSDSPLDTNSSLNGLQTSSGDTETSDGSSTKSSITPTRDTNLSAATSDGLPNSPSGKKGKSKTAAAKNGQPAEVS